MSARKSSTPAKPRATKAPAKPTAPAKPAAPAAKASVAVAEGITPSVALSNELTANAKKAHSFRLKTMEDAIKLGYKPSTEPPFDNVVVFEKGNVKFRVTYSTQDYVRKVEGAVTILPGEKRKWIRLNAALAENA